MAFKKRITRGCYGYYYNIIIPLFLVESDEPVEHHRILQDFEGRELHGCLVVSQGVGGDGGVAGVVSSLVQANVEEEEERGEEVAGVVHGGRLI